MRVSQAFPQTELQLRESTKLLFSRAGPKSYLCNVCGREFKFRAGVVYHVEIAHMSIRFGGKNYTLPSVV